MKMLWLKLLVAFKRRKGWIDDARIQVAPWHDGKYVFRRVGRRFGSMQWLLTKVEYFGNDRRELRKAGSHD